MAKAKKDRKVQQHIDGTGPEKLPKIINAAQDYAECRAECKEATLRKNSAEEKLISAMEAAGLREYFYGEITVKLKGKTSVGVRIKSAEGDEEGDDE